MSILDNVPKDVDSAYLSSEMFDEVVKDIIKQREAVAAMESYKVESEPKRVSMSELKNTARRIEWNGVTYYEDKSRNTRIITWLNHKGLKSPV